MKEYNKKNAKLPIYDIRSTEIKVKYPILLCNIGWKNYFIFRKWRENNVEVQSFDPQGKMFCEKCTRLKDRISN